MIIEIANNGYIVNNDTKILEKKGNFIYKNLEEVFGHMKEYWKEHELYLKEKEMFEINFKVLEYEE